MTTVALIRDRHLIVGGGLMFSEIEFMIIMGGLMFPENRSTIIMAGHDRVEADMVLGQELGYILTCRQQKWSELGVT